MTFGLLVSGQAWVESNFPLAQTYFGPTNGLRPQLIDHAVCLWTMKRSLKCNTGLDQWYQLGHAQFGRKQNIS